MAAVNSHRRWSNEDDQFILDNRGRMSDATLARRLGRGRGAVGERRRLLTRPDAQVYLVKERPSRDGKVWSEEDDYLLREYGDKTPMTELAEQLGRSVRAVEYRLRHLGIWSKQPQPIPSHPSLFEGSVPLSSTVSVPADVRQAAYDLADPHPGKPLSRTECVSLTAILLWIRELAGTEVMRNGYDHN